MTPSTAWSSAASSKMMFAALPPSSSVSFLSVPAIARWISFPTSVEPVNATLSTSGCFTSAAPARPSPVTMFTTPGGSPACRRTSQKRSAESGVVSAGFRTTVLPVASAGAIFHESMRSGKFQGMICAATPSGRGRAVRERVLELVRPAGVVEEVRRRERQVDVAGLLDRLAAVERLEDGELAARSWRIRAIRKRYFARSPAGRSLQPFANASRAALTATSTSSSPAYATSASASSVAGLTDGWYSPERGSTHSPPMKSPYRGSRRTMSRDSGAGA